MRPLDDLKRDIELASIEGHPLLINRAELKMLKDYGLVSGTADKDVVVTNELFGPLIVTLNVVEVLP